MNPDERLMLPVYEHDDQHRDNNPHKSQWTISKDEEHAVFRTAVQRGWLLDRNGWGLHLSSGNAENLGISQDRLRKLMIAKFRVNSAPVFWHGYPADPWRNEQDIPDDPVLADWLKSSAVPAAKVRKLMKGIKCHL